MPQVQTGAFGDGLPFDLPLCQGLWCIACLIAARSVLMSWI